ncbi:MAG TPA: macro domain-containing protein [Solirubrobacterales bacterium]|nr:macro domain-containing protein [Solirubrobacterales bacterium]
MVILRSLGGWLIGYWQRRVDEFRHWRWRRVRPERFEELTSYRIPVQVCPRGCEYHEAARRDLLTRTSFWGRVETQVATTFETSNCPKCGAQLVRECARCKHEIFAPVVDRCQSCGLPQPWAAERRAAAERAGLRKWHPDDKETRDEATKLFEVAHGDLWVVEGDITRLEVDAVVSNVDVDGQMWAEVASAIRKAAGEEVEQRAQDDRPYKLGEAWDTSGGDMGPALKGIIHVASMNRRGESSLAIVRDCLNSAMDKAVKKSFESVAVGAFGSGPNAIDAKDWQRVFVQTVVSYLTNSQLPEAEDRRFAVVLVLFEPQDFDADRRFLADAVEETYEKLGRPSAASPVPLPF